MSAAALLAASAPLGEAPALPLHTAGKYVAGAYVVLFAIVLIYVAIMAIRLGRMESELGELLALAERRDELDDAAAGAAAGRARQAPAQPGPVPAYPTEGRPSGRADR
ncbi:MAG TPA: hypothetical protein VL979_11240 [Solirubrobacteraceae bacterium]|nr:hypothetical protein [Solirubrobacteraceae bacterium]